MQKRPRGYMGINHETIGSDILSVLKAVHLPEVTLGKELAQKLSGVQPDQWYPIGLLLEALETLDRKMDAYALRSVGWNIFKMSHEENVRQVAHSARDILYGFNQIYLNANRGIGIGGWKVLGFEPGRAEMDKTTPHHCVMEEGIIQEALRAMGVRADVTQTQCFRKGAESCHFLITSSTTDERWGGKS
jgi:hypothetical protein